MEVHAHTHTSDPDMHRGKKKWTHYLWEFLMLFLAVTLGFFVENQREHYVDRKKEKEYIRSMIEDLKTDTSYFAVEITARRQNRKRIDTLVHLLSLKNRTEPEQQRMYYLARYVISQIALPQIHDRTY